ncbi:type II toxin-antitoxin system RelE/ParE family toxin [Lacihabitans sp. CCS-44]|uniref:type II toxin-antitoxin system RelE/ParE family toxin n=1 Tax=Lacihabitans sp. CCS-44 TaxID=2487331 RepID=UPI0020CF2784|nr:type II toxin-antitoxin system RelE/ParE family toxin [Lacihabitans sp. CCS-44]MCP9754548.1 type II toxin-antitoxin system RelE/ParE family toxin [Lacihabitans sp. CCS-44]
MLFEIYFTPTAENHILEAHKYYSENVSDRIAEKFYLDLQNALDIIEINPFFQIRTKNYRAYPLRKFPFLIFYEVLEEKRAVKVLSVFNTSKNPSNWP